MQKLRQLRSTTVRPTVAPNVAPVDSTPCKQSRLGTNREYARGLQADYDLQGELG
jgi:hypothetical protein